jgi:hypothetical protein
VDTGGSQGFSYLVQLPCSASNTQQFTLTSSPLSGWYYLHSSASNLCWDIAGGSYSAGALIQQYTCTAVPPEYFQLKAVSGGYEILSKNLGNGCIDVTGASTAAGANLVQDNCAGSASQLFAISNLSAPVPAGSTVTLRDTNSNLCVDTGGSPNFTTLVQSPCSTSNTQQFTLTSSPTSGWYYLTSSASKLCWDIQNGSSSAGALLQQYTCTAVSPEYFQLKAVSGGYEILSGNLANGCVGVVGASTASGANLEHNTCTGSANQVFAASVVSGGTTGQPQIAAVPSSVSFGSVTVGVRNSQSIKLTNSGTANLTISQSSVSGTGFSISGLSLPMTLTPGQNTTFNVALDPTATGSASGSISLASNTLNSPTSIALSGTGVTAAPTVAISSPANGATVSGTITVSGTASDSLGVSSVAVQLDSGSFSTASGTTTWTVSLNATSLSNAAHTITARATDTSGSTATTSVTINVSNTSGGPTVNVKNFGATGNGSGDDTAAISSAISALTSGATLSFPCGTYLTSAQLTLNLSDVTVDGSGCATIHNTSSGTVMVIGGSGNGNPNYGSAVSLAATANELATSFSTTSSLGVSAGDYVRLQQGGKDSSAGSGDTGCDAIGCRGELLKVASVSGNTITVTTALHDTYNPSVNGATAQKLLGPITGITVKNITFDGNGSNVYGLAIAGVADSTVTGVTSRNVQGSALLNRGDFNVSWSNITVTGAGSAQCGSSAWFENQSNLQINGLSISNENQGAPMSGCLYNGAFGFELIGSSNNTITNLTVDGAGASGRPMKLGASRWNTLNSVTAKNGVAAMNGLVLHYYSSHNNFNNCVVTNNGAGTGTGTGNAGINLFGNFNQYNTFNNCTVSGNGNVQFFDSGYDALRLAQDTHNTISGGTFTGSNSVEAVILIEADGDYITGATINGPGAQGIYLDTQATNACVNNTTFMGNSGLSIAISANASGDIGAGNLLNLLSSNLTGGTCTSPLP